MATCTRAINVSSYPLVTSCWISKSSRTNRNKSHAKLRRTRSSRAMRTARRCRTQRSVSAWLTKQSTACRRISPATFARSSTARTTTKSKRISRFRIRSRVSRARSRTTWRATARAVTLDTKVGVARQKVISRKDVILRPETPRFMTQGDTVTLSGIVHNYLKQDKSTQISISVSCAQLLSPAQQTVTIAKQGEHRVDWRISAPQTGEITLLAKALTDTESDAVELALGVVPRGLHETKAQNWTTPSASSTA